jgi:hypothetical protein
MKDLILKISWDRYKGEFPIKELQEVDPKLQMSVKRISATINEITLTSEVGEDEEIPSICYGIGAYVHSIVSNRFKLY